MKRIVLSICLILCALPVCAQAPSDVPRDHWAYEAVNDLVSKGYMEGTTDGRFLGDRTMTRYEFAAVIKRILDSLVEKVGALKSAPASPGTITETSAIPQPDLDQIRKLVDEFKSELLVIGTRLDTVEKELGEIKPAVDNLNAIVTDPEGAFETLKSDVGKLKKITLSGYVQARYNTFNNDFDNSVKGTEPGDNFSVRRARIKVAGKPTDKSTVVIQVDCGQNYQGSAQPNVTLKDAYADYAFARDPSLGLLATMGQMKWVFGYEVQQSSSVRESPERALIVQRLFPNERDRGFVLAYPFLNNVVTWKLGVYNGLPTNFPGPGVSVPAGPTSPFKYKALVSNIKVKIGDLDFGISGFNGRGVVDANGARFLQNNDPKTRWGADLQYYLNNLSIKAEYINGQGVDGFGNTFCLTDKITGGWAQVAWNFLKNDTLAVKWETISQDPKNAFTQSLGRRSAWDLGILHWLDDRTRLKLYYIINEEEKHSFSNNAAIFEWITTY